MPTERDLEDANRYVSIMREIKQRAESINSITGSNLGVPPPFLQEYGYLQLRMICELVGIACLVAHGDIADDARGVNPKSYKPGEILNALEALHPSFFPTPRTMNFKENEVELLVGNPNAITKAELISLWGRSGDYLHRGGLKKLGSSNVTGPVNFQALNETGQKILDLLSVHLISRVGGNFHFLTALSAPQIDGDVLVSIAEGPGAYPPSPFDGFAARRPGLC
jgi:hypothetical protein